MASAELKGLENDPEGAQIVAEELGVLASVLLAATKAEARRTSDAPIQDDASLLSLREQIAVAKPEDLPALFEQMHTLSALKSQRSKSAQGVLDTAAPYFAHIRLEEVVPKASSKRKRDLLIGNRSYIDTDNGVRIVDWRQAPVSKIYYRYRQGDDYEEELGDAMIEGKVLLRRSVAIVKGTLRRITATEGTFVCSESGEWRRLDASSSRLRTERGKLGQGEKSMLPAIASMLDGAQYALITREGAGLVAIQGSAGSGKTTVGLHRVAYLAEHSPNRFKPESMMVVVPNEALLHYTSRVLPELGVNGVPITTFMRFAKRAVMVHYQDAPSRLREDTPPAISRLKSSAGMLRALDIGVDALVDSVSKRFIEQMEKWDGGGELISLFAAEPKLPIENRLTNLLTVLNKGASSAPESTRQAAVKLCQDLRQKTRRVQTLFDEILTDKTLLQKAFADQAMAAPVHIEALHEWCVRQSRVRQEGERDGEEPSLDEEDLAILLRLWQKVRGSLKAPNDELLRVTHIFIDEVQDAGPVELAVLLSLVGPNDPITLAGDVAQRMLEDDDERGEFAWQDLLTDLGLEAATVEPLKVSYRSTKAITAFARGVLGPYAHAAEPIAEREGPPVEAFQFASVGESVGFLADALKELARVEPDANVAVLSRFAPQADIIFEGLERSEVENIRRVKKQNFTWEPGVDVTDVRQTKGLEFDEVILSDATRESYPDNAQARHAMYVGATRAAHQLWCMVSGSMSKVVEDGLAQK
jgi:DNA helicase II / ATP-dependent DNA helicase PcrA